MKNISSKRAKALQIPTAVKRAVAARDEVNGWTCCFWCREPAPSADPLAYSNAHYIARSKGGLGIEQNIITLCPRCHKTFDQPSTDDQVRTSISMKEYIGKYLRDCYPGWCEEDLVYKKWQ